MLQHVGKFPEAYDVLTDAEAGANALGDASLAVKVRLLRLYIDVFAGRAGDDWSSRMAAAVDEAIPIFEAAHDEPGLVLAWRQRAGMYGVTNRNEDMAVAFEQVQVHARAANDRRAEVKSAYPLAAALLYGPTPVANAIPRCEELAQRATTDQSIAASIQALLAQLYSMDRRFDQARALVTQARRRLEDLGATVLVATAGMGAGNIELRANDLEAAEREFRTAYDQLSAIGEKFVLPTVGGLLSRVLTDLGRIDEAEALVGAMEAIAGADDVEAQAILQGVRARLDATAGRANGARGSITHAIDVAHESDSPTLLAEVLMDQGAVLEALGDAGGAADARSQAAVLLERKGDRATVMQL